MLAQFLGRHRADRADEDAGEGIADGFLQIHFCRDLHEMNHLNRSCEEYDVNLAVER